MSHIDEYCKKELRVAIAKMASKMGFSSIQASALKTLTAIAEDHLQKVASHTGNIRHEFCEDPGRPTNLSDIQFSFRYLGISTTELVDYVSQIKPNDTGSSRRFPFHHQRTDSLRPNNPEALTDDSAIGSSHNSPTHLIQGLQDEAKQNLLKSRLQIPLQVQPRITAQDHARAKAVQYENSVWSRNRRTTSSSKLSENLSDTDSELDEDHPLHKPDVPRHAPKIPWDKCVDLLPDDHPAKKILPRKGPELVGLEAAQDPEKAKIDHINKFKNQVNSGCSTPVQSHTPVQGSTPFMPDEDVLSEDGYSDDAFDPPKPIEVNEHQQLGSTPEQVQPSPASTELPQASPKPCTTPLQTIPEKPEPVPGNTYLPSPLAKSEVIKPMNIVINEMPGTMKTLPITQGAPIVVQMSTTSKTPTVRLSTGVISPTPNVKLEPPSVQQPPVATVQPVNNLIKTEIIGIDTTIAPSKPAPIPTIPATGPITGVGNLDDLIGDISSSDEDDGPAPAPPAPTSLAPAVEPVATTLLPKTELDTQELQPISPPTEVKQEPALTPPVETAMPTEPPKVSQKVMRSKAEEEFTMDDPDDDSTEEEAVAKPAPLPAQNDATKTISVAPKSESLDQSQTDSGLNTQNTSIQSLQSTLSQSVVSQSTVAEEVAPKPLVKALSPVAPKVRVEPKVEKVVEPVVVSAVVPKELKRASEVVKPVKVKSPKHREGEKKKKKHSPKHIVDRCPSPSLFANPHKAISPDHTGRKSKSPTNVAAAAVKQAVVAAQPPKKKDKHDKKAPSPKTVPAASPVTVPSSSQNPAVTTLQRTTTPSPSPKHKEPKKKKKTSDKDRKSPGSKKLSQSNIMKNIQSVSLGMNPLGNLMSQISGRASPHQQIPVSHAANSPLQQFNPASPLSLSGLGANAIGISALSQLTGMANLGALGGLNSFLPVAQTSLNLQHMANELKRQQAETEAATAAARQEAERAAKRAQKEKERQERERVKQEQIGLQEAMALLNKDKTMSTDFNLKEVAKNILGPAPGSKRTHEKKRKDKKKKKKKDKKRDRHHSSNQHSDAVPEPMFSPEALRQPEPKSPPPKPPSPEPQRSPSPVDDMEFGSSNQISPPSISLTKKKGKVAKEVAPPKVKKPTKESSSSSKSKRKISVDSDEDFSLKPAKKSKPSVSKKELSSNKRKDSSKDLLPGTPASKKAKSDKSSKKSRKQPTPPPVLEPPKVSKTSISPGPENPLTSVINPPPEATFDEGDWKCPVCNHGENGDQWVCCDKCEEWYHFKCVGITQEPTDDEWYCVPCTKKLKAKGGKGRKKKKK